MRCRECLVTFAADLADEVTIPDDVEKPKRADFKEWANVVSRQVESREDPRSYLQQVARATWNFVAWLTHARNATHYDAVQAVEATGHCVTLFVSAVLYAEQDGPSRCPDCGSYRMVGDMRWSDDRTEFIFMQLCESCGYETETHRDPVPDPESFADYEPPPPPPEGDSCRPLPYRRT